MSEKLYRKGAHWHLPSEVYRQSMTNTPVGGTPDFYYEASGGHTLWVEWKWTNTKRPKKPPAVTPLQALWLSRAHNNNVQVAVIEGCPLGGFVFPGVSWSSRESENSHPLINQEVAIWICTKLGVKYL